MKVRRSGGPFWWPFGFSRGHPSRTYAKSSEKLTFLTPWYVNNTTLSTPSIHWLYALMAWGCDTFTLLLPCFHRFTFPTGSTLTALLPIVITLSFHRICSIWSPDVKYWYSPQSIFLNSLIHFNGQPFVLSARKVPVTWKPFLERVYMSWYDEKKLSKKTWWSEGLAQGESDDVTTR